MTDRSEYALELETLSAEETPTNPKQYQVFISHSKKDREGRSFFKNVFAQTNSSAFFYADHNYKPPHFERILNTLRNSSSLFVLLSSEMSTSHTRTWVAFEVGLAKALGKNVWVFENPIRPAPDIPVPGADAYVQRRSNLPNVDSYGYKKLVETGGLLLPKDTAVGKKKTSTSSADPIFDHKKFSRIGTNRCAYNNCKHAYFRAVLKGQAKYLCPACRQSLAIR